MKVRCILPVELRGWNTKKKITDGFRLDVTAAESNDFNCQNRPGTKRLIRSKITRNKLPLLDSLSYAPISSWRSNLNSPSEEEHQRLHTNLAKGARNSTESVTQYSPFWNRTTCRKDEETDVLPSLLSMVTPEMVRQQVYRVTLQ
jgi:hypothetical protein